MKLKSLSTAVLACGIALAGSIDAAFAATVNVNIQGFAFTPKNPTVNVGDTVVWTQNDASPHTVSSTSAPFVLNSGNLGRTATYSHIFNSVGTFPYRCNIHPSMTGSITVQAPPNQPPTVSFVSPSNGQAFIAPLTTPLQVNAQDDVSVARVDFYRDGLLSQTINTAPFTGSLTALPAGNYSFVAVAVDNVGLTGTSAPVNIFVVTNSTLLAPQFPGGVANVTVSNAVAGQPYILDAYVQNPGTFPGAWGPIQTSVAPASVFQISDPVTPLPPARLYRVRQFVP